VLLSSVIQKTISEFVSIEGLSAPETTAISERCSAIQRSLESFVGPPFTLQRLCELLVNEPKLYKSTSKFVNAIEKMFAVSGILPTLEPSEYNERVATQAAAFAEATREAPPTTDREAPPPENNPSIPSSTSSSSSSDTFEVETTAHPPEPMDIET